MMRKFNQLEGVSEVLKNLRESKTLIGKGADRGLRRAGLFLLRESQKIVPVQTGNLRGSGFIRAFGSGMRTDVIVGYTALYAAYVHEDLEKAHGAAFNVKYAEQIATRPLRKKRRIAQRKKGQTDREYLHSVESDPYFRRGERQQAKFIETPARQNRDKMLAMIASEMKRLG